LGEENEGFKLIMANFAWERLLMAIGAVGAMQRLIETTVAYASSARPSAADRQVPGIRHQVAEMATKAEAARALTYNALRLFHEGQDCIREVTHGQARSPNAAVLEIADESLQIHGGYGYMREYGIERAVRDARLGPIGGGTDEIMKEIIGKGMGL
jgi:acyl-CoA dehydrogenase